MGLGDSHNSTPMGTPAFSPPSGARAGRRAPPTGAPRRRPRAHLLAVALAVASLVAIAACVAQSSGTWLADNSPEAALAWGLVSSPALSAVADRRIDAPGRPGDDGEAMAYARQALLAEPLDVRALRVLALETEKAGSSARARIMMVVGDRLTRRDTITELWLFQHALANADWPRLYLHADAMLRRVWRLEQVLFPGMTSALRDPAAVAPLVARLEETPDWRKGFLNEVAWRSADPADAARLFASLAATSAPPTDVEGGYLVERYVSLGDYKDAKSVWTWLLPRGAPRGDGFIYNGDFRPLPGAPPFNWRLVETDGASVEITPAADGAPALHVVAPAAKNADAAAQLLDLPPGSYRLSGAALVEPGQTGDLFSWRVGCVAQTNAGVAETRQGSGVSGWRPFSIAFAVPAQGCDAQWLALEGLAHAGMEPAEAWYRGLTIRPIGAKPASR